MSLGLLGAYDSDSNESENENEDVQDKNSEPVRSTIDNDIRNETVKNPFIAEDSDSSCENSDHENNDKTVTNKSDNKEMLSNPFVSNVCSDSWLPKPSFMQVKFMALLN